MGEVAWSGGVQCIIFFTLIWHYTKYIVKYLYSTFLYLLPPPPLRASKSICNYWHQQIHFPIRQWFILMRNHINIQFNYRLMKPGKLSWQMCGQNELRIKYIQVHLNQIMSQSFQTNLVHRIYYRRIYTNIFTLLCRSLKR